MSEATKRAAPRRLAATTYFLVAVAVAALLLVGAMAEVKSRDLAVQAHRAEAARLLEASRIRMSEVLGRDLDALSRLAGVLQAEPGIADEELRDVAARLLAEGGAEAVVALGAADEGRLRLHGGGDLAAPLRRVLAGTDATEAGARGLVGTPAPTLALWIPVDTPVAQGLQRAIMVIDTGQLFATAGLTDPAAAFDFVLVAAPEDEAGEWRALHLGHGAALLADPVVTGITLPGGVWTLAAAPRGGWTIPNAAVWPIRLLTLMAVGLVAFPMLRIRSLVLERQRNIAELHDRGAELRRLSQRLGLAIDASQVGVWDFNTDTGELIWDVRMAELYAVPPEQRAHSYTDWSRRLHPEDHDRAQAEFADSIRTGSIYRSDYRLMLPDGALRHIRAIGQPWRDDDGLPKIVGVNWDVTEEVGGRTELEERRREAEAATAAKSQFLATISHELRTPMNGVVGMLDLMLRAPLEAEQRERARIARQSAEHLLALLNDVLDLSKLEAEGVIIDSSPINPEMIAGEVVALLSAVAGERGIDLGVFVDGPLPDTVIGDATRIRQVMINLVGNAIKFTDTGSVQLRLSHEARDGGILEVVVRDTGIGIPEAARRALFQRFSQVDQSDAQQRGGTGLGLAISKQLVELMGGEIAVESVEGLGSTFRFWIPAAPSSTDAASAPVTTTGDVIEVPADSPAFATARILVAEDNPTNQKILLAYLEIAGHEVHLVANGADAVEAAAERSFDLIILDIQMPVMDGLQAARSIRAQGGLSARKPILALTASSSKADRERFLAAGIDDYLTKPVAMQSLFVAIAAAIAAAEPDAQPVMLNDGVASPQRVGL